jgi:hypothetical protein
LWCDMIEHWSDLDLRMDFLVWFKSPLPRLAKCFPAHFPPGPDRSGIAGKIYSFAATHSIHSFEILEGICAFILCSHFFYQEVPYLHSKGRLRWWNLRHRLRRASPAKVRTERRCRRGRRQAVRDCRMLQGKPRTGMQSHALNSNRNASWD